MKTNNSFKVGNVVSLHFDTPSAIGYNGMLCVIQMIGNYGPWRDMFYCKSIKSGHGCWARKEDMVLQSEKHVENHGFCVIEIGD